ncbi:MAG: YkgJ family cysteine cluster protein [Theionarchaea archaeon]|nr:MAG: hypothetical protein AYK19_09580 [Theionarchaea archaeon DG-70-1]MBU7028984.1 YkgJ family cysteine cluster protein [Theionarchaea archaeon]
METDPAEIKKLGKEKEDENWKFRTFLKMCDTSSKEIDAIVHRLYKQISSEIDCKTCRNCCKELLPVLDEEDIEMASQVLGLSVDQFTEQYLVMDEFEREYTFDKLPCQFLVDNKCQLKNYRPKSCKSYPYLHKEDFTQRLISAVRNCSVCPIVYNVYEQLKEELQFDPQSDEFGYDDFDLDFDFDDFDLDDFDDFDLDLDDLDDFDPINTEYEDA